MPFAQIIAAQAMRALMDQQRVTTDNLANSSTSGFQKGIVAFRAFSNALAGARQNVAGSPLATAGAIPAVGQAPQAIVSLDPSRGKMEQTGNPLDLALEGRGWLVAGSAAAPRFVRSGSFTLDGNGQLVTSRGEPLLGEDGNAIHVEGRTVRIDGDGTVSADGKVAGRLLRVDADSAALAKAGGQVAAVEPGALKASQVAVRPGWLEGSNVEPVGQMVDMIQTLRSFDYLQHVVRAEDEMLQRAANDVGRTR